jgi:hypothetical protein
VIKDLIAEASATKNAIDEAVIGIDAASGIMHAPPTSANNFDGDLFGFDGTIGVPASNNNNSDSRVVVESRQIISPPSIGQPEHMMDSNAQVTYSNNNNAQMRYPASDTATTGMIHNTRPNALNVDQRGVSVGGFDMDNFMGSGSIPMTTSNNATLSSTSYDGYGIATIPSINLQAGFSNESSYGGNISEYKSDITSISAADAANAAAVATASMDEVNELRRRAKEASDVARDAEESHHNLLSQLDELRKIADEAEAQVRHEKEIATAAEEEKGKRKGFLGRGKKKQKDVVRFSCFFHFFVFFFHYYCFANVVVCE